MMDFCSFLAFQTNTQMNEGCKFPKQMMFHLATLLISQHTIHHSESDPEWYFMLQCPLIMLMMMMMTLLEKRTTTIIERIRGAMRPPPYSALNRWWLEWEAGAAHEQKCPYPLNTIQYNSIQLNTTQYNSIQLIKLFWHLPLTIFCSSPLPAP